MHQIQFTLTLCPRPRWGSSQPPDPLAGFKVELHRIRLFQIRPEPNFARFLNSNPAGAEAGFGWNLFFGHNNLLILITSYPTINPVVRCVPLASLSCTFSRQKPILDAVLSPLLLPKIGTIYLLPLQFHHHLTTSNVTLKHIFLPIHNFLTT